MTTTDAVIVITPENAREILDDLRWTADRIVVNPFGERVWLRERDDRLGITDCCPADEPCDYHAKLTNQAQGAKQ